MNTKNLSTLNIHKLTRAQYDRELAAGKIDEDALYLVPDTDMTDSEILARLDDKADKATLASSTVNGLMAKEDKIKLNSISGYYGVCSGQGALRTKKVNCSNFKLENGATIFIYFDDNQRCAEEVKLNINNTGGIEIVSHRNNVDINNWWNAGEIVGFTYNGTNYVMHKGAPATTTYYGITKLTSTISDSESLAITPKAVNAVNSTLTSHIASISVKDNTQDIAAHVKLSDEIDKNLTAASGGTAATPKAISDALDSVAEASATLANDLREEFTKAISDANAALVNGATNKTLKDLESDYTNKISDQTVAFNDSLTKYVRNDTNGTIDGNLTVTGTISTNTEKGFIGNLNGKADTAGIADALVDINIGDTNTPVYFNNKGKPETASGIVLTVSNLGTKVNENSAAIALKADKDALNSHIGDATHVTSAEKTAWNSAEQNAKKYADEIESDIRGGSTTTLKTLESNLALTDAQAKANAAEFNNYTTTSTLQKDYATKTSVNTIAENTLGSANDYTDEAISGLISGNVITGIQKDISDLSSKVNEDIANLASNYTTTTALNTTLNSYATKTYTDQAEIDAVKTANSYTDEQIGLIIENADSDTLNSIKELASAITENDNAITALEAIAAERVQKVGDTMTGNLTFDTGGTNKNLGVKWSTVKGLNPYIGYATDQLDGTFTLMSIEGTNYASGLAIGGSSKNLLWKGKTVATTEDVSGAITTLNSNISSTYATQAKLDAHAGDVATNSKTAHVKLSDATDSTLAAASGGTAATPKAVSNALSAAKSDSTTKVNNAKTELLGDAAADYNTLGKLEDKIIEVNQKAVNNTAAFDNYYTKSDLSQAIIGVTASGTEGELLSFTHKGTTEKTKLSSVYASHTKAIAQDADMYLFGSIDPTNYKQIRYNTKVKVGLTDNQLQAPSLKISGSASTSTLNVSSDASIQGNLNVVAGTTTLGGATTVKDNALFEKTITVNGDSSLKGDVTIAENVTLHYNAEDKCLEFQF